MDIIINTRDLTEAQLKGLVVAAVQLCQAEDTSPGMRGFLLRMARAIRGEVRRRAGALAELEAQLMPDDDGEGALVEDYDLAADVEAWRAAVDGDGPGAAVPE